MRITFRIKLTLIVGTAALALVAFVGGSAWIASERLDTMHDVEGRLVPRLELGPQIVARFEQLRRGMQDAVAAQDQEALDATEATRDALAALLDQGGTVLDAKAALEARSALDAYYDSSRTISRRLIAGETGETLVDDIREMQSKMTRARTAIERAASLQKSELNAAFALIREANERASRFKIATGVIALVSMLLLSLWFARTLLRALNEMSGGLSRFATGDFERRIQVQTDDELGDLALVANQMAASLEALSKQRDRNEYIKSAQVGLAETLRDEQDPKRVAQRAVTFLAKRLNAAAGVFFVTDDGGHLRPFASYAREGSLDDIPSFALGEGLVGQAALSDKVLEMRDVPTDYARVRSGTGEGTPIRLVFLPLTRAKTRFGVVELSFFGELGEAALDVLSASRGALVAAIDATTSRAALAELLKQTQEQADRLAAQEEELRANNEELHSQQEELRTANERLQAQSAALSSKNTALEVARAGLQTKAAELAQVSTYKSQFLAKMSHELRTPLNSMLLLSQLLAENDANTLTAKQVEFAKTIHSAGTDLLHLINQVLDLAKIEAGKQEILLEEAPLDHFLHHVERVFAHVAKKKGLELVTHIAPGLPPTLITDVSRVERILTNLVGNALKFTQRGKVEVSIKRASPDTVFQRSDRVEAPLLAFEVRDTGLGISEDALQRLFAPFEQVTAPGSSHAEGTGLGLAIARESAVLLGGEVQVKSVEGQGATFTCYLPEHVAGSEQRSGAMPASLRSVPDDRAVLTSSDRCLLIIEDDPVLAEQLVEITRDRHFRAIVARTGKDGIRLASEVHPHGIILDVRLPDTDGFKVMDRLKRDITTAEIPVHFLSAIDSPSRGLSLGAIGYLVKPATRDELVGMVRTLTANQQGVSHDILVVEDDIQEGTSLLEVLQKEGVEATHVVSAEAALERIRTSSVSCMILDLGLPDMDGLELLQTIASDDSLSLPRVIVHTGRALTREETRRIESYAEAVVLKDGSSQDRLMEEMRLFLHHIEERQATKLTKPLASEVSLRGTLLLLADDDMRTVYALSALMRARGAKVLVADNGREAVELLNQNPKVDAVLMDVMMPEMDGYEAMRWIRNDPRFRTLPVIALTARAMKGERERCIESGASEYLTKPVDGERLLTELERWLEP